MEGMRVRDYNGQSDSEVGEQQIGVPPWYRIIPVRVRVRSWTPICHSGC